jgi:hypothetical protein
VDAEKGKGGGLLTTKRDMPNEREIKRIVCVRPTISRARELPRNESHLIVVGSDGGRLADRAIVDGRLSAEVATEEEEESSRELSYTTEDVMADTVHGLPLLSCLRVAGMMVVTGLVLILVMGEASLVVLGRRKGEAGACRGCLPRALLCGEGVAVADQKGARRRRRLSLDSGAHGVHGSGRAGHVKGAGCWRKWYL